MEGQSAGAHSGRGNMTVEGHIPVSELASLLEAAQHNGVEQVRVVRYEDQSTVTLSVPDGDGHYGQSVTVQLAPVA
jgi:hypothetical protein